MSAFQYYPKIQYKGKTAVNLLVNVALIKEYAFEYNRFYDYIVKEGERPDMIAYEQYKDASLDWVIYVLNDIVDPYSQWVMDSNQFKLYLEDKYNTSAERLTSTTISTSIAHYYYKGLNSDSQAEINSYNYLMTEESYIKNGMPAGWVPKSIYEYELEKNEAKRQIKLLKPVYIEDFKQQFKDLINA